MKNAKKQRESKRNNLRNLLAIFAMRDMASWLGDKAAGLHGAVRSGLQKKAARHAAAALGPLDGAQDRLKAISA